MSSTSTKSYLEEGRVEGYLSSVQQKKGTYSSLASIKWSIRCKKTSYSKNNIVLRELKSVPFSLLSSPSLCPLSFLLLSSFETKCLQRRLKSVWGLKSQFPLFLLVLFFAPSRTFSKFLPRKQNFIPPSIVMVLLPFHLSPLTNPLFIPQECQ